MRLLLLVTSLWLCACPRPSPMDAGTDAGDEVDAGTDAGRDAGRPPPRDAGVDAGWVNVPVGDWCVALATARCWRDVRCGRTGEALLPTCIAQKSYGCDPDAYLTSNRLGRHAYDAAQAVRCLNAYAQGGCELEPSECSGIFLSLTGPDAGALVREDCDTQLGFFERPFNSCPRCTRYAGLGESCFDSSGSFAPSCQPGVHGCEYIDAGFQQFCIPARVEGESCRSFSACARGYACNDNKCAKRFADAGEACDEMNFNFPYCGVGLFCRQDPPPMMGTAPLGTCQRRVGLGGTCSGFGSCIGSLRCSSNIGTGTCVPRAAAGQPCSRNDDCQDGLYCPKMTSRCAPLPGDGGDCSYEGSAGSDGLCAPGYHCEGNFPVYFCRPRKADGEPCPNGSDNACQSNECLWSTFPDGGMGYRCVRCWQVADAG